MQATSGYSPTMMAAKEPFSIGQKVESSGVSTVSTSAPVSPDLRFVDEPSLDLMVLQEDKTDMSKEAMGLLLPGLKRMRRDATSVEEKRKLAQEIDAIESKLGITSACPQPHKCTVSRKIDLADESVESRRERIDSAGDEAEARLKCKKNYAAVMLPGLRRMRQSAPMEERVRLNQEIQELEETIGVVDVPAASMKFAVSRREDRDDANDASKDTASLDVLSSQAGTPDAGQATEMTPEVMALLLPGLKRMHRDARTIEERTQLTEEIKFIEASLKSAGTDDGSIRWSAWAAVTEKEAEISQEFASMMLPGLRRMRHSASSDDRIRLNQEIAQLEEHLGVAATTVETAKCAVSRREDRD